MSTNNLDPPTQNPSNDPPKPDPKPLLLPDGRLLFLYEDGRLLIVRKNAGLNYDLVEDAKPEEIFNLLKSASFRWAPNCTCIQQQTAHLKQHNKALYLTVFLDDRDDRVQVDIKELPSHQRVKGRTNKNMTLAACFCPFCGRQYDAKKEPL